MNKNLSGQHNLWQSDSLCEGGNPCLGDSTYQGGNPCLGDSTYQGVTPYLGDSTYQGGNPCLGDSTYRAGSTYQECSLCEGNGKESNGVESRAETRIAYTLTRSNRKTLALYVRDGVVEIRAPLRAPKSDIDKFVALKKEWIADKLAKSKEQMVQRSNFSLTYGDHVMYHGKPYPIAEKPGNRIGFDDACFYMPPGLTSDQIKYSCVQIYRLLAKRDLTRKTLDFASKMSVIPASVKINGAKTRWGSCSSKKSVNYSWRLIMADDDVIDYVVVHELSHIIELNHSPRFWALIKNVLPDYAERKVRLKSLQQRLGREDWD